jgi:hypothetical protein
VAELILRVVDRGAVSEATGHPLRDVYLYRQHSTSREAWLLRTGVPLVVAEQIERGLATVARVERDSSIPPNLVETGAAVTDDVSQLICDREGG